MSDLRTTLAAIRGWGLGIHARNATEAGDRAQDRWRHMTRSEAWALFGYLLALLLSHLWLAHLVSMGTRTVVALLPLPPIMLIVVLAMRRMRGFDELQQRMEGMALASVAAVTWLGFGICWLLQHADVPVPSPLLGFWGMPLLYVFARRLAGWFYA